MKHIRSISQTPARAQLGATEIISIVAAVLSSVTALLGTILPLFQSKR